MIFKQLFEEISSTYTYLIGSEETGEAVLIDPVLPTWQRDLEVIKSLQLNLIMTVETHIHADHITSAKLLQRETGSKIAGPGNRDCGECPANIPEHLRVYCGHMGESIQG